MSVPQIELTIDGRTARVPEGSTLLDAARSLNLEIPVLCHAPDQKPVGVCRVCTVEVTTKDPKTGEPKKERVLAAACIREAEADMVAVETSTDRVKRARRTVYEMLLADHPTPCLRQQHTQDCELEEQAKQAGVQLGRFASHPSARVDDSSPIIRVDHTACILCDRCIRGCSEIRENFVIGRTGKGPSTRIAFDLDVTMARSSCVGCGECMVSCPTGALTNKGMAGVALPKGKTMTPDELLALEMFSGVSGTFLELNRGSVVRRQIRAGEVICREGEPGATAFYLERGEVEVSLSTPIGHLRSDRTPGPRRVWNVFRRLTSLARADDAGGEARAQTFIPIDAPVDLPYDRPVASLGAGELFGEMTCLSRQPRSATVRAVRDTQVLEMLSNVLYILRKNKAFRATLDRRYRERALRTHLGSVLAELPQDLVDSLCERAELLEYRPGDVIVRQGDASDAFFLIRLGFVKVSTHFPGGDMVVAYLGRSDYFGEIGLLQGGVRTATCSALDHVEVVRISAADFADMIDRVPELRAPLAAEAETRLRRNRARQERVSTVPLDDFLAQGLMEAQSLLLLDLERCTRCDLCVRACAETHDGVTRLIRDGLRFDNYLVATSCRSCRDPLCMIGCPVGSIHRGESLDIKIEDWCIGCGSCARSCPYGNISMHTFTHDDLEAATGVTVAVKKPKATTCDLSRDLKGELKEPACVYACPHGAAMRVDAPVFFANRLAREP